MPHIQWLWLTVIRFTIATMKKGPKHRHGYVTMGLQLALQILTGGPQPKYSIKVGRPGPLSNTKLNCKILVPAFGIKEQRTESHANHIRSCFSFALWPYGSERTLLLYFVLIS